MFVDVVFNHKQSYPLRRFHGIGHTRSRKTHQKHQLPESCKTTLHMFVCVWIAEKNGPYYYRPSGRNLFIRSKTSRLWRICVGRTSNATYTHRVLWRSFSGCFHYRTSHMFGYTHNIYFWHSTRYPIRRDNQTTSTSCSAIAMQPKHTLAMLSRSYRTCATSISRNKEEKQLNDPGCGLM